MASSNAYSIRGLAVKHGFFKSIHKGEDAWTQKPGTALPAFKLDGDEGPLKADVFGVYDGHGGKQAATFASRHLLERLQAALERAAPEHPADKGCAPPELAEFGGQLAPADWAAWAAQERLVGALPEAFEAAFGELQADFFASTKESGTTATVAALAGWDLVVANVGDSCAFLDTGAEVLQVSGNHRLESSRGEQERLRAAGCEVSPTLLDGKPCGPLRVWPGGLAMSRTLGDWDAGEAVLAQPDVRHVTLPAAGARLVIASDGLWDAVGAKSALHGVRALPASKAAHDLVTAALKAKGLRDDITVLVVDCLPAGEHRLPPALAAAAAGKRGARAPEPAAVVAAPVAVHSPGEPGHADAWRSQLWQRRLQAVQAAFPPQQPEPEPEPAPDSLASSGTMLAADLEARESDRESDSAGSEALAAHACGGAFDALLGDEAEGSDGSEQEQAEEQEQAAQPEEGWETVAAKPSKPLAEEQQPQQQQQQQQQRRQQQARQARPARGRAVPSSGRKHGLAPSTSPSDYQQPKAAREAPASPMQTSEASSLGSAGPEQPRRARGRGGRGSRGRASHLGGGGRGGGEQPRPPRHVNGFQIRSGQPPPPTPPGFPDGGYNGGYAGGYGGGYGGGGSIQFGSFGADDGGGGGSGGIQFGSFGPGEMQAPAPHGPGPYGGHAGQWDGGSEGRQGGLHPQGRDGGRGPRRGRGPGRGRGRGRSHGRRAGSEGMHEPAAVHVGA